jgi:glycosyltransferase involved in cell wall biosynthesis
MVKTDAAENRLPLVSVIVPTFNRPDMLRACLGSILHQTYPAIEILVVNDGGIDISAVVESLNRNGNMIHLVHDRNRGLAAARNSGIGTAKGRYIAYLDDDDLYYPEHIATLVETLETCDLRVAYTDAFRAVQKREGERYVVARKDVPHSDDFNPDRLLVHNYIPVLCVMHDRSCLEDSGRFDESLPVLEDWDLWIRMSRKYPFRHVRKITCEYAWKTEGGTLTSSRRALFWQTVEVIYANYRGLSEEKPRIRKAQRNYLRGVKFLARMSRLLGERSAFFQLLQNALTTIYRWRNRFH